jgi:hypothetical protein
VGGVPQFLGKPTRFILLFWCLIVLLQMLKIVPPTFWNLKKESDNIRNTERNMDLHNSTTKNSHKIGVSLFW